MRSIIKIDWVIVSLHWISFCSCALALISCHMRNVSKRYLNTTQTSTMKCIGWDFHESMCKYGADIVSFHISHSTYFWGTLIAKSLINGNEWYMYTICWSTHPKRLFKQSFVCKITGYVCLEFNSLNIYFAVSGHRILDLLCVPFVISDAKVRCHIAVCGYSSAFKLRMQHTTPRSYFNGWWKGSNIAKLLS